jgi:hypothetical protein
VELLVDSVIIQTEQVDGKRHASIAVRYRFNGSVETCRDKDSWPPPA